MELMQVARRPMGAFKAAVGGVLGMGISFVVNSTLAEISINPFFSVYFGVLFAVVGGIIVWRVRNNPVADDRSKFFFGFGCLVILAGVLCFVLEKNWFVGLSPYTKVPLYAVLGTAISFSLAFAVVDLVNYLKFCVNPLDTKAAIHTPNQVLAVLWAAVLGGLIFGFIFGSLDVEDAAAYQFKLSLLQEEYYCYPIGAVFGIVAGLYVEHYNLAAEVPAHDFNDEI